VDIFIYFSWFKYNMANEVVEQRTVPKIMATIKLDKSHPIDQIYEKNKYETMKCLSCPILHECSYTKKRVEKVRDNAKSMSDKAFDEEIAMDSSAENVIRAQGKRKIWYDQQVRATLPKELEGERCVFEKKEIVQILGKFYNANYDFNDPRVHILLQELVSNILNVGRINKAFTTQGVLLGRESAGGPVYYANPLLKARAEFSELVIKTSEVLDKMLKSDEQVKSDRDFTSFLLSELQLRERQKKQAYVDKRVYDVDGNTGELIEGKLEKDPDEDLSEEEEE